MYFQWFVNNDQTEHMDLVSRAEALTLSVHFGGYLTLLQKQNSLGNTLIVTASYTYLSEIVFHPIFFFFV